MKPHPKIRKTVKWGGAVVSVLLVVVILWSVPYIATCQMKTRFGVTLACGRVSVSDEGRLGTSFSPGCWVRNNPWSGLLWNFEHMDIGYLQVYAAPLWPAPTLSLTLACIAWYLDTIARRRARLNLCRKCNYDRTGLAVGAVCPECGNLST